MLDTLLKQLRSPEPSSRKQAIIALGKLGEPGALKGLSEVYSADPDPALRRLALKAGRRIQQQMRLAEPDFLVGVQTWGDGLSKRSRRLQLIPSWIRRERVDDGPEIGGLFVDLGLAAVCTLMGTIIFSLLALKPLLGIVLAGAIHRTDTGFADPASAYLDSVFTPLLTADGRTLLFLGVTLGIVNLCLLLIFNGTVHFAARMLGTFESYGDMLRHVLAAQSFTNLIFFALVTLVVLLSPPVVVPPFLSTLGIVAIVAICTWYSKLYAQAYGFSTVRGFAALLVGTVLYTLLTTVGGVILPLL